MLSKATILGVDITNEREEIILEYILEKVKLSTKFFIVTPNPEILVFANSHERYKKILNSAEISLADGAGLFLASLFLGKPLKQRIPGVDFIESICKNSVRNPISMGFLGGRGGVAEKTAECLLKKYPHLKIVYIAEEWDKDGFENARVLSRKYQVSSIENAQEKKKGILNTKYLIHNTENIDLLFVAYGAPKQEEWIYKNLDHIPVTAAMGVGGAFDYISGRVLRAPFLIRAVGFEWLFRLVKEPWRFRRQLALIEFVKLVFRERFGHM